MTNRKLRKYNRLLTAVNARSAEMKALADADFPVRTRELREKFSQGADLLELLPESYALAREAARRSLGMYPYDVQVLGAIALNDSCIAEMMTGEGKTLAASMALYLNALTGKSCILVTTNEYLAVRDGRQMGKLYRFLGLTVGIGVPDRPGKRLSAAEKRAVYASDIVYTTNSALGFDYLIDNLAKKAEERFLRPWYYVIVDEADAVLLDSARTPLVISGAPRARQNLYGQADNFVSMLRNDEYVTEDDRRVWLTEEGFRRAERYFGSGCLCADENQNLLRHIMLALQARQILQRDRNYVVEDGRVVLLDGREGRKLENTKIGAGLHQALEAREQVPITSEHRQIASITYQDFFHLFPKLAGMSGTAAGERTELRETYGLDVVCIPTNREKKRTDERPQYFLNKASQMKKVVEDIRNFHEIGRPVLVITESIGISEALSKELLDLGISHNVLNALDAAKEAEIIAESGIRGAVTVATPMAGRGTDIRLEKGVEELGGLAVLVVGLMENRRMELQAVGRSGRQGDPGLSRIYISPEDMVVQKYGPVQARGGLRMVRAAARQARRSCEEKERAARKDTAEFGMSMAKQRELVYQMRNRLLGGIETDFSEYRQMILEVTREWLEEFSGVPGEEEVLRFLLDQVTFEADPLETRNFNNKEEVCSYVVSCAETEFARKREAVGDEETFGLFLQQMTLRALDGAWVEQADYLQQLRGAVSGRRFAQRNVMHEYHREAYESFGRMEKQAKRAIMRNILLGEVITGENGEIRVRVP